MYTDALIVPYIYVWVYISKNKTMQQGAKMTNQGKQKEEKGREEEVKGKRRRMKSGRKQGEEK